MKNIIIINLLIICLVILAKNLYNLEMKIIIIIVLLIILFIICLVNLAENLYNLVR